MTSVSVVMRAHDVAPFAAKAITSVPLPKHHDLQIVLVNSASLDTREFESVNTPFETYIPYVEQPHRIAAAQNTGIAVSCGEVIAILDPDDICEPDYLSLRLVLRDAGRKDGSVAINLARWEIAFSPQTVTRIVQWPRTPTHVLSNWIG